MPSCDLGLGSGRLLRYRLLVLALTFFTYASFHMSRKAPSIVKGALHPHVQSSHEASDWNPVTNPGWLPFAEDLDPENVSAHGYDVSLSQICEANSDGHAGTYKCADGGGRVFHGPGYNLSYCAHYASTGDGGKFNLRLVDATDAPHARNLCVKHGAENGTVGCWVLNGNAQQLSAHERAQLCTKHVNAQKNRTYYDCTLYVQPSGQLIPAPADDKIGWLDYDDGHDDLNHARTGINVAPAGITNGKILLGGCDTVYLIFYAIGLFVSGHVADHMSLRLFLTVGMLGSGTFVALIGAAHAFGIHSLWYFYLCYAIQGLFQSTGWPAVVAVMGNWFPKNTRGLVMGVWNAHTSVGNIAGSLISGAALGMGMHGNDWPAAFYLSGALIAAMGVVVFLFLPNKPEDVGLPSVAEEEAQAARALLGAQASGTYGSDGWETAGFTKGATAYGLGSEPHNNSARLNGAAEEVGFAPAPPAAAAADDDEGSGGGFSFLRALRIPGVFEFAMALFFAKFVAYMFIYWLPYYLGHLKFSTDEAANISAYFDLGGIVGGIVAGWASDRIGRRAPVAFAYLVLSVPALFFYRQISAAIGDSSLAVNILIMLVCGAFVNGPYALITTAVSADLGSHESLKGDLTLTATVTGIIDGTGSVGASIQGVLIGIVASGCTATGQSWDAVFDLLMICCAMSGLCLARLVWKQGPADVASCASHAYRAVVVVLMLGMVCVGIYCSTELLHSCAGSQACRSYEKLA